MKIFGLILLIATAGQLNAQRSEFVEYLLQLQYIADPLHDLMTGFYATARASLSEQLTGLNDESVHEITNGLRSVIEIRDSTEDTIATSRTGDNDECVDGAIASWPATLTTVGDDIASCADEHVDPIFEQTENFHLYMQEQNRAAFNAQNMVLNVFTELNPLTSANEITPVVSDQIDAIYEEFIDTIRPEIERRLADITELRNTVPGAISTCVAAGVERFNVASAAIVAVVGAC